MCLRFANCDRKSTQWAIHVSEPLHMQGHMAFSCFLYVQIHTVPWKMCLKSHLQRLCPQRRCTSYLYDNTSNEPALTNYEKMRAPARTNANRHLRHINCRHLFNLNSNSNKGVGDKKTGGRGQAKTGKNCINGG